MNFNVHRFVFTLPRSQFTMLHCVMHSSHSYPIQSNTAIKDKLSSYPLQTNFMRLIPKPLSPDPRLWHYFVECDDALHRIYRLTPLNDGCGPSISIVLLT